MSVATTLVTSSELVNKYMMTKTACTRMSDLQTHRYSSYVCVQEAGQIHPAPHPPVWDALHGVRLPAREHRSTGANLNRARSGILSGKKHTTQTQITINTNADVLKYKMSLLRVYSTLLNILIKLDNMFYTLKGFVVALLYCFLNGEVSKSLLILTSS